MGSNHNPWEVHCQIHTSLRKDYIRRVIQLAHPVTRKKIGRNTGKSGRINLSGSELDKLGLEIGDEIELNVVDDKDVARALIDSKALARFLIVTPF